VLKLLTVYCWLPHKLIVYRNLFPTSQTAKPISFTRTKQLKTFRKHFLTLVIMTQEQKIMGKMQSSLTLKDLVNTSTTALWRFSKQSHGPCRFSLLGSSTLDCFVHHHRVPRLLIEGTPCYSQELATMPGIQLFSISRSQLPPLLTHNRSHFFYTCTTLGY
jgi:hypothetical protein